MKDFIKEIKGAEEIDLTEEDERILSERSGPTMSLDMLQDHSIVGIRPFSFSRSRRIARLPVLQLRNSLFAICRVIIEPIQLGLRIQSESL